jgi:phage shock protein PspC (stress-responsive transcriptional regulator)
MIINTSASTGSRSRQAGGARWSYCRISTRPPGRAEERCHTMATSLTRPREGRRIAGVCAGLARRWGVSPTLVRLLFVVSCILPGPQFLIYLALWVIMPSE